MANAGYVYLSNIGSLAVQNKPVKSVNLCPLPPLKKGNVQSYTMPLTISKTNSLQSIQKCIKLY